MAGYVRHRPVMYYHYLSKILPILRLFKRNERIMKLIKLLDLNSEFYFVLYTLFTTNFVNISNVGARHTKTSKPQVFCFEQASKRVEQKKTNGWRTRGD